jgi:Pyruvate/2-oxoacid:ferredoxin oxidoreductase delta subunit
MSLLRGFAMPINHQNCALLCSCSQRGLIPGDSIAKIHSELTTHGWQVTVVSDLCEMAINDADTLCKMADTPDFLIAACRPRATRWLLHRAGVSRPVSQIQFQDIRPKTIPTPDSAIHTHSVTHDTTAASWPAWFPVIDYDRCNSCRQCVSFCAFGVYSVSGKSVHVTSPSNCKDNCPACARICPSLAIIFPKVDDIPINGDEVTITHLSAMKETLTNAKRESTGRNLHSILASRRVRQTEKPQEVKASPPE